MKRDLSYFIMVSPPSQERRFRIVVWRVALCAVHSLSASPASTTGGQKHPPPATAQHPPHHSWVAIKNVSRHYQVPGGQNCPCGEPLPWAECSGQCQSSGTARKSAFFIPFSSLTKDINLQSTPFPTNLLGSTHFRTC